MDKSIVALAIACAALSCNDRTAKEQNSSDEIKKVNLVPEQNKAIAAFAEGCFWCSEHIFESLVGIDSAVSGYAGGTVAFPTYELVNTETTGHAETVLVYYDSSIVSYADLVRTFFTSHDPTTPGRQGPDIGSSYRSILFYLTPKEKEIAESILKEFQSSGTFTDPIVTEIKELKEFYRAEEYHQQYVEHNPASPYVRSVSIPRFEMFKRTCPLKLK
jgi:peptide-methionine (S)-S-oxide reductase